MSLHSPPLQPLKFWNAVTAFAAAFAVPAGAALPAEGHSLEAKEDRALARRAAQDMTAFSQIYQRYVRRVYAYHLARTGKVQDAQDLTSQTFMGPRWKAFPATGETAVLPPGCLASLITRSTIITAVTGPNYPWKRPRRWWRRRLDRCARPVEPSNPEERGMRLELLSNFPEDEMMLTFLP